MRYRIIDIHRGGQLEEWLVVYADGRIERHVENDGYAFLRHGAEARDEWINLDFVHAYWPHRVDEVQAAINELIREEEE